MSDRDRSGDEGSGNLRSGGRNDVRPVRRCLSDRPAHRLSEENAVFEENRDVPDRRAEAEDFEERENLKGERSAAQLVKDRFGKTHPVPEDEEDPLPDKRGV